MRQSERDVKLGRFLSLVLRHDPGAAGILLDANGWADVQALLQGVNRTGRRITLEDLERIVAENNKQRYSFSNDHRKIRANQGHSVGVDVELPRAEPPARLYHGTATRFLDDILAGGLVPGTRQHVHLSADIPTAVAVGRRHGKPLVLQVDAAAMHQNGHSFFLSQNGVWLCYGVPGKYLSVCERV